MNPDVSIVIVNWNGLGVLIDCLKSIFSAPQGVQFEVVVFDNGSTDGSIEAVEREFPQVVLIRNGQNLGFAAGNNRAFAQAKGRHILLLNNDTVVLPGALEKSAHYLDENPKVGALGCRQEFPNRTFQTSCCRFTDLPELFMIRFLPLASVANERLNFGRYWGRQFTEPTEVDVVAGCFMMVRREVIDQVGGFDEDFFMYGEDEEWCSRIKGAGWGIVYFPQATTIHHHRFSSRRARRALRIIECMAPVLLLHKRRGRLVAWLGNIILLAGMLLRLPAWLVLDTIHICKGTAQDGLIRSRFVVLKAHLCGIFRPIWIPRGSKLERMSTNYAST